MICWYCHWGWSKPVADIYTEALRQLGGDESPLHYGPAHIVWADENFEREHVEWCLAEFDKWAREWNDGRYSPEQLAVVHDSLEKLMALPEEIRAPEPADYDDENPANYPPAAGLVMVKVA